MKHGQGRFRLRCSGIVEAKAGALGPASGGARGRALVERTPPHAWFLVSAVFHYLGPAFAVLLFARVDVLGVAWLRIASAAAVFALWRRPWRAFRRAGREARALLVAWGAVLAVMNCCFYEAIDRLPLGTVAAIEFLPVIVLAAIGARTARNGAGSSIFVGARSSAGSGGETAVVMIGHDLRQELRGSGCVR